MPTYTNTKGYIVTVDNVVFKSSQTLTISKYLNDTNDLLTLDAHTPYYNPILEDTIYTGSADSTSEVTVAFNCDFIHVYTTKNVEIYRNSLDNSPPQIASAVKPLKIDNKGNGIRSIIIKFIDGSATSTQITMTKDEAA